MINEFSKVAEYKINVWKSIAFLSSLGQFGPGREYSVGDSSPRKNVVYGE